MLPLGCRELGRERPGGGGEGHGIGSWESKAAKGEEGVDKGGLEQKALMEPGTPAERIPAGPEDRARGRILGARPQPPSLKVAGRRKRWG